MNEPTDVFAQYYNDRLMGARDLQGQGQGVVGIVGNAVPVELILAAGLHPILVAAESDGRTPYGDVYMEDALEPEVRSIFDRILSGAYAFLDLLVIPATTEGYGFLYTYLKEVVRIGEGGQIPPLALYDLMYNRDPAVRDYGLARTRDLLHRLQALARQRIDDAALVRAIESTNRKRNLLRQLDRARRRGLVSGTQAIHVIGAGFFMPHDLYEAALADFIRTLDGRSPAVSGPRLLVVPSVPLYHDRLHKAIEAAGGVVVAEDDWCGTRCGGDDIALSEPPLEAIFSKAYQDTPSPRLPREERHAWLRSEIERGDIDGVVFYVPRSDQYFGWSYPDLKAFLDGRNVPSALIRDDVLTSAGADSTAEAMKTFLTGLRASAPTADRGQVAR